MSGFVGFFKPMSFLPMLVRAYGLNLREPNKKEGKNGLTAASNIFFRWSAI